MSLFREETIPQKQIVKKIIVGKRKNTYVPANMSVLSLPKESPWKNVNLLVKSQKKRTLLFNTFIPHTIPNRYINAHITGVLADVTGDPEEGVAGVAKQKFCICSKIQNKITCQKQE